MNVCIDNDNTNTNCKKVSEEVIKAAKEQRNIDCEIINPIVIRDGSYYTSHYAIKFKDLIIDYTITQFIGDNKTVDAFILKPSGEGKYAFNKKTKRPQYSKEVDNTPDSKLLDLSDRYIIEITKEIEVN